MGWKFFTSKGEEKISRVTTMTAPSVKVVSTAGQSIANAVRTMFTAWNGVVFDTYGGMWSASNPSRLVAPVAGKYLVVATVTGNTATLIELFKNAGGSPVGTAICIGSAGAEDGGPGGGRANLVVPVMLNAGEYVELSVYQSSGGAATVGQNGGGAVTDGGTGFQGDHFAMTKIDGAVPLPLSVPNFFVGQEVAFVQRTTSLGVTAALAPWLTLPAFTADGTSIYEIQAYCPRLSVVSGAGVDLHLYEGGTDLGFIGRWNSVQDDPFKITARVAPAAGSRTYSIQAISSTTGSTIFSDVGGTAALLPSYARAVKVA